MPKILIVEDDADIAELYELILTDKDFDVVVVGSKTEALDQVPQVVPDLLLIDVMLAGEDGREVCQEIKTSNPHAKVILLSANAELLKNYERWGADAAIPKPFKMNTIVDTVNTLLKVA